MTAYSCVVRAFLFTCLFTSIPIAAPAAELTDVTAGVGEIRATFSSPDPRIFVLEEQHASLVGQLQQAVMLLRLKKLFGVRHIALEGYLPDQLSKTAPYLESLPVQLDEGQVASLLDSLSSGNIGAGEFAAAVLKMKIPAVERSNEYFLPQNKLSGVASFFILRQIAANHLKNASLDDATLSRLAQLKNSIDLTKDKKQKEEKIFELQKQIILADPWAAKRLSVDKCEFKSTEDEIRIIKEVRDEATRIGIESEQRLTDALNENIRFLEARSAASKTMVTNALSIANTQASPIALIIGAAHTERVFSLLKEAKRSTTVMRNLALARCDHSSDMDYNTYEAVQQGRSVGDGAADSWLAGSWLAGTFGAKIRPQPRIGLPVNQAKDELYSTLSQLGDSVLRPAAAGGSGGGDRPGGVKNLAGASPDPKKIDPKTLLAAFAQEFAKRNYKYVAPDISEAVVGFDRNSKKTVLVIPINLTDPSRPETKTTRWFKLEINRAEREERVKAGDDFLALVERRLLDRIERTEKDLKEKIEQKAERVKSVIDVSLDYSAQIFESKSKAMEAVEAL
jgi:hypothetical protein